jgi:ribosomal protein S18 acetylase RimI-like enzyme
MTITYTVNKSLESHIFAHLVRCSPQFDPPLDETVDLASYSNKIFQKSHRIEAWANDELIGLVAVYINNEETQIAYITNVSVDFDYLRMGIAARLIQNCIDKVKLNDYKEIHLEVGIKNQPAIELYKRFGFIASEHSGVASDTTKITLKYIIKETQND